MAQKLHPLEIEQVSLDGCGTFYYTRGHHDPAVFLAALEKYEGGAWDPAWVRQGYAFWGIDGSDGEWTSARQFRGRRVLFGRLAPGRGRFPVTGIELHNERYTEGFLGGS